MGNNYYSLSVIEDRKKFEGLGMYHCPIYRLPNGDLCATRATTDICIYLYDWGNVHYVDLLVDAIITLPSATFALQDYGFSPINNSEWVGDFTKLPLEETNPFDEPIIAFSNWLRGNHKLVSIYDFMPFKNSRQGIVEHRADFFECAEHRWYLRWAINLGCIPEKNCRFPYKGIPGGVIDFLGADDGTILNIAHKTFWERIYSCVEACQKLSVEEYQQWGDWLFNVRLSTIKSVDFSCYDGLHLTPPIKQKPKQLTLF